jgi:hypothetical protein
VVAHVLHEAFGGEHEQDLAERISRHIEFGGERDLTRLQRRRRHRRIGFRSAGSGRAGASGSTFLK